MVCYLIRDYDLGRVKREYGLEGMVGGEEQPPWEEKQSWEGEEAGSDNCRERKRERELD